MSMTVLTILQIAGIMAAYLGSVLLLPWIVLRRKLSPYRTSVRFMAYFLAGNFYLINLVMALQLLHISCRPTLVIGVLLPFLAAMGLKNRAAFFAGLEYAIGWIRLVAEKQLGFKTILLRLGRRLGRFFSRVLREWIAPRWLDLLLACGTAALVLYMYGSNAVAEYGYCASDIVVHNYWINEMGSNHIFAAGVYPFGFHCIIYYLHTVFSIPTYVLLRLFYVVQTLMIHLVLLAFLKAVCRSKYAPYAGVFAYMVSGVFSDVSFVRFYASLPQEFGRMFILPAAYFAIAFFQEKLPGPGPGAEPARFERAMGGRRAGVCLALFAISISLTLAGHFYDTFIAAFFCVGIAAGFCFRCFQWRYLKRILAAGMTGILLAALPMGIAYAAGTPLEGSLYWGMSVISAGEEEPAGEEGASEAPDAQDEAAEESPWDSILKEVQVYVTRGSEPAAWFLLASTGLTILLGLLWYALHRPEYGGVLVSAGVFMALLFVAQAAERLGLPQLLEISRYSAYIAYGMALIWSLCLDGGLSLLLRENRAIHAGSLAAMAAVCAVVVLTGFRPLPLVEAMETNGAVTCLTNIIRENRNGAPWTICSANDERQMARDYGYHYELIDFLREMEDFDGKADIKIPTDTVYFFIEKEPRLVRGKIGQQKSGRTISAEAAEAPLPGGTGSSVYGEDARLTVMSRMYGWAQAFQRLYPSEMEVYYETDEFVCYRVRQNTYSLYNFAIDYGYN